MHHLVTAVAGADPPVGCRLDHLAGTLPVQDDQHVLIRKHGFVDKGASELGLSLGEEGPDEVLFHIEILVEELGQQFLVNVFPDAHQGELEEPGHGRREGIVHLPMHIDIHQQGLVGQPVEESARLVFRPAPDAGRLGDRKGLDRQKVKPTPPPGGRTAPSGCG